MNAAFLLVTSALIVGQAGDKKAPAPAAPAPAATSSCGPTCGSDCGCEGFGHRLRDRFGGLFNRCDSCDTCKPAHVHHERCAPACAPAKCDTCDSCGRTGFLAKLRDRFGRHDCGCGCETSSCCGSAPAAAPEKINTPVPKKMPEAPKAGKAQEVRIENLPAPNAISVAPAAPVVEVPAIPTPRADGDRRDPF